MTGTPFSFFAFDYHFTLAKVCDFGFSNRNIGTSRAILRDSKFWATVYRAHNAHTNLIAIYIFYTLE